MTEKRYVRYGFGVNDEGEPVPIRGQLQVEYSVDPWTSAPPGHVLFWHDNVEYAVPESDLARFKE